MPEMNVWPGLPLNQTPETMRVYKTRVLLECTHQPFHILTYPQWERKNMDLHLEARLLSFSKQVNGNFLRSAGKVLRAEKEKLFLSFERSSSKWIVFVMDFVIGFNEVGCLDHGRVTKFVFFKRVEWGPGNKTWEIFEETSSFCFKTRYDLIRTVLCRFY